MDSELGLAGLSAAGVAKHVLLTDLESQAVELAQKNIEINGALA